MLPIPDPCGKLGTLISVGVGVAGGLNSFAGETLVHVRGADGQPARRPIAQIRTGDEVLAWDEMAAHDGRIQTGLGARSTSATRYEKVTGIISNEKQQRLVHITLNSGNIISATDGHPFRTSEGWRDAILLKRGGQLLLGGDGNENDAAVTATIIDVRVEIKTIRVYNLEVKNLHTFFVGEDGLLVHNGNGSYTCYFVSGKKYHGKGDFNRAQQSAKEKANKYNDKVEKINWSDAKNDKQSFQHEHQRIQTDAFKVNGKDRPGYENNNNYNQRASPGAQFPLPRKKPPSGTDFRK
nr:Hint domain-containing protein [Verminephrobacter aporrectodeae]